MWSPSSEQSDGDLAPVLGNLPLFSIVSIPPTQLEIQEAKTEVGARYRLHRVGARAEEKHRGPAEGVWCWGVGGKSMTRHMMR